MKALRLAAAALVLLAGPTAPAPTAGPTAPVPTAGLPAPALTAGLPATAALNGWSGTWIGQDPWPTLVPGATAPYTIRYRNTGSQTWERGVAGRAVNLAVNGDSTEHAASGLAFGWPLPDRPATAGEAMVASGATATFTFAVRAPSVPGEYAVRVHLVLEGVEHFPDEGVYLVVRSDLGFHSRWVSQSPYPTLAPDATSAPYTVSFRNTGTRAWQRGVVGAQANLGINGDDRTFSAYGLAWPTPDRPTIQSEATVAPGAIGTFTFQFRAPPTPGRYTLHLRPVIDGVTWMEDEGVFLVIAVSGGSGAPTVGATVVQSGLRIPWDVAFAPDGRMFVTERVGNILVYASAAPGAPLLSNTAVAGVRAEGEAGLMSIELDPNFSSNGHLYACVSVTDEGQWRNQVIRYRMSGNAPIADLHVIRRGMLANSNHDGCRIRFGPDGKLWVTMGDAGVSSRAQDPNALNGKVLRVNGDGTIPADNPVLAGAAGRTAIYTMGNRNPQGLAFEPGTGRAFEVEHGDSTHDEINILVAGGNYGYPIARGSDGPGGFLDPAWSSGGSTTATSGGDFAFGPQWGSWSGSFFVANLKEADLRRFVISGATATQAEILFNGTYGRLRTVRLAPDGSLYLTTSNGSGDRVIRVAPN